MISIHIPDFGSLELHHLVLDYNGTLAVDGHLITGVDTRLTALSEKLTIHVVTADTFGKAAEALHALPCALTILPQGRQDQAKLNYIEKLGLSQTAAMGNGRNDRHMLKQAALGVVVLLQEGAAADTLAAADVVCRQITDALDLLLHPRRLVATLRS